MTTPKKLWARFAFFSPITTFILAMLLLPSPGVSITTTAESTVTTLTTTTSNTITAIETATTTTSSLLTDKTALIIIVITAGAVIIISVVAFAGVKVMQIVAQSNQAKQVENIHAEQQISPSGQKFHMQREHVAMSRVHLEAEVSTMTGSVRLETDCPYNNVPDVVAHAKTDSRSNNYAYDSVPDAIPHVKSSPSNFRSSWSPPFSPPGDVGGIVHPNDEYACAEVGVDSFENPVTGTLAGTFVSPCDVSPSDVPPGDEYTAACAEVAIDVRVKSGQFAAGPRRVSYVPPVDNPKVVVHVNRDVNAGGARKASDSPRTSNHHAQCTRGTSSDHAATDAETERTQVVLEVGRHRASYVPPVDRPVDQDRPGDAVVGADANVVTGAGPNVSEESPNGTTQNFNYI